MELKKFFLREVDGDKYLIPAESIENFDERTDTIESLDEDTEEWYEETGEFNDDFSCYIVEGNLYSTPLFLKKHPSFE